MRVPRLRMIAAALVIAVPATTSPAGHAAERSGAPMRDATAWSPAGFAEAPGLGAARSYRSREPAAAVVPPNALPAPPEEAGRPDTGASTARIVASLGLSGIPEVALRAYRRAEETLALQAPSCGLRWWLLAAIGRVESDHGRFGGARLREDGYGTAPIRGIPLDGRPGVAQIRDTDGGALDGDGVYDRAVGPMQFIPSTWGLVAADGNGDGRRDPDNLFDAALGAAVHLCAGRTDLQDPVQLAGAVRRYNHSDAYVRVVLELAAAYALGQPALLPEPGPAPSPAPAVETGSPPPASVGPPPALSEAVAGAPASDSTSSPPADVPAAAECSPASQTTTTTTAAAPSTTTTGTGSAAPTECTPTSTTTSTTSPPPDTSPAASTSTTTTTVADPTTTTTTPDPVT